METCKQQEIVALVHEHITDVCAPADFIETLDSLFDDWVTFPDACWSNAHRSSVLVHYRNLQQLLRKLQELELIKPKCSYEK
ncbi:MAG: hypothetical protein RBR82_17550 [Pseudomonas sp.]|jgi:hypothetical protein|nr:hypothetical protein [Pseudomonas sp.]